MMAVEPETRSTDFSPVELALSTRNHGLPLEALRYDLTPVGLHYLLIHFDIPQVDVETWRLEVGGEVRNPLSLSLAELRERPKTSVACTLECAGNGRARLTPRPLSQPWLEEAVGNAEWTGTPLAPLLEEAGIEAGAVEVLFTGLDRGLQGEIEHAYERSLRVEDAVRPELLLAYEVNGQQVAPTVSICNPSQPLLSATRKAIRHATPHSTPATVIGESCCSRVLANHTAVTSVTANDSQPRKLPAAIVPFATKPGAMTSA